MARRRDLSGITRPFKLEVSTDQLLLDDLTEIAKQWKVPRATAAYWLLRGLVADARGDRLVITGDSNSERLARWLVRKYPQEAGKD